MRKNDFETVRTDSDKILKLPHNRQNCGVTLERNFPVTRDIILTKQILNSINLAISQLVGTKQV